MKTVGGSAWIDALPGCAARGHTREEALLALQDAADAYIEDMEETDEQVLKRGIEVVDSPLVVVTR